jgi:hypothetical protein
MAVALLIVAVPAGDPAVPVVELPQTDASRRERARHRLGQTGERVLITCLE